MIKSHSGEEISERIQAFLADASVVAGTLRDAYGLPIESGHVENALIDVFSLEDSVDLLYLDLTEDRIISTLEGYDFRRFFPVVLGRITFRLSIIPRSVPRFLVEQRIRRNGEIWEIHKNDADPFPSNPHAHNLENRLKLHLGTGELFKKRQRMGRITRKHLLAIREEVSRFELPLLSVWLASVCRIHSGNRSPFNPQSIPPPRHVYLRLDERECPRLD